MLKSPLTSYDSIIWTRPLRQVRPEVGMENHTHTPVFHRKSHKYTIDSISALSIQKGIKYTKAK